jgi:hypothetical protein
MKKSKMKVIKGCRKKSGCTKGDWELMQATTFETQPIIRKKAA